MRQTFTVDVTQQPGGALRAQVTVNGTDFVVFSADPASLRARLHDKLQGYFDSLEQKRLQTIQDATHQFTLDVEVYGFTAVGAPMFG